MLASYDSIGSPAAEKLTTMRIECKSQWASAAGFVLCNIGIVCAKTLTTLLNLLLQLITNGPVEFVTMSEVSGQEVSVERHK